jgi:hypothetical protein
VPGFAATIPFSRGAAEIIAWYDAKPEHAKVNEEVNMLTERILSAWETVWPNS